MTRSIRPLRESELNFLLQQAKEEGWNPGLDDATIFKQADPDGIFGCFIGGEMTAAISAVAYDENFGFVGLYISPRRFRGQGYGRKVWNHAMSYLGTRTIGLDGVPAQQANYAKMGFETSYRTWRWSGSSVQHIPDPSTEIVSVTPCLFQQIFDLDARAFPAQRQAFMEGWLGAPRTARALMRDGRVVGFGVVRHCHDGCKIGPLFAETEDGARQLFTALSGETCRRTIHIDVPEPQVGFSAFLEGLGFQKGFDTARMYKGKPPVTEQHLVFGITTLELG